MSSIWILSLVTLGLLGVWRGSWLQVGMLSSGKRSAKQGERGPSGSPCLWVTGLEVQPCPKVYPSDASVSRVSCLPPLFSKASGLLVVPCQCTRSAASVCSHMQLQLEAVALWFRVLCSCRAVMPWEGWERPACVLSPWQSYLKSLTSVRGCSNLGTGWMLCVLPLPSLGRHGWRPAPCRSCSGGVCKLE